jgi:hypothetical protein
MRNLDKDRIAALRRMAASAMALRDCLSRILALLGCLACQLRASARNLDGLPP